MKTHPALLAKIVPPSGIEISSALQATSGYLRATVLQTASRILQYAAYCTCARAVRLVWRQRSEHRPTSLGLGHFANDKLVALFDVTFDQLGGAIIRDAGHDGDGAE